MLQSPPHVERDSDGNILAAVDTKLEIDARRHLLIRALRNWYHMCIGIIDDILEYSPESLQSWKDCIETALCGKTFATMLEPFLRHEANARSIGWSNGTPTGQEVVCFSRFQRSMLTWAMKMVLFETKDGYFALGPKTMQNGDFICVLFGSKVPFVMRRVDDYFVLVGECFILGLMDGEAVGWLEEGLVGVQRFEIR